MRMRALFIHSGWRTGSTYVWTKFRQNSACLGFYEPFNEMLSAMSPTDIYTARHDLAALKHSEIGLPYFHEYIPLLGPKGHPLFKLEFSYRNYFVVDEPLPDQQAYVESLLGLAGKLGRMPTLGFVRSLGRVAWFRRAFADAVNIVVLRSPLGQWLSARQLALEHQHEFFDPMQTLILAQARGSAAVIDEAQRLGVLRFEDHPLYAAIELARQMSAKIQPAERFARFAALYALSYLAAVPNADLVIDMDRLSAEAGYQAETAAAIHRLTGVAIDFSDAAMPRRVDPDVDLRDALAAIRARLADMPMPHGGRDAGREAAARTLLARKFADDEASLRI
jgi:hypothetical protein